MALTNAERQARYRDRLKKRASLDALGEQAREACDRAVEALWSYFKRTDSADADGFAELADYRAIFVAPKRGNTTLASSCRQTLRNCDDLTDDERAALRVVVELDDAMKLRDPQ